MKKIFKKISSVFLITVMLFVLNYGEAGATLDATLFFNQSSVSTTIGQTVTLVVIVNPGSNQVGGAELDISFIPSVLRLDSITRSSSFNTTLSGPTIDNTNGTGSIDVGLLTSPATYISSISDVATFVFTALAPVVNSPVSIVSTSEVSALGEYVTATRTGAQITIADNITPTVTDFTIPATSSSLTVPISTFTATDNIGVTGYKLTETSSSPSAGDSGWSASVPTNYTFSSAGTKTLYAWAKDAAGNVSTSLNDSVDITLPTYTIGGSISGLTGTVVLQNNSGDDLTRSANGTFTFATALHDNDNYNVVVYSQPVGQTCTTSNNTGTISGVNVTNVTVTCVDSVDAVSPIVTNFIIPTTSNSLTVPISTFTATDENGVIGYCLTTVDDSAGCSWSGSPQSNYVFSFEGNKTLYAWAKDAAGNVSTSLNDSVDITLPTYTIGGSISGLTGTVVLQNNSGDDLTRSANGSFTFATALHDNDNYNVVVYSQPVGQTCTTSNNTGTISGVNVTNVAVTCVDNITPTVTDFTIPATSSSLTVPISTFTATDNIGVTGYKLTETSSSPSAGDSGWSASVPTNYTFSSAGTKTLYAWAKDAAGNVSTSLNDSVSITLSDTIDPVVTGFVIPSMSDSLIISITTFTATDATGVTGYLLTESLDSPSAGDSGWLASVPTNYTFSSAGTKTLYAWAKDAAGNVSTSLNDSVNITLPDSSNPIIEEPDNNEETNESGEIDISDPTINLGDEREDMEEDKRIYTKNRKLSLKGEVDSLKNGKVKVFIDGELSKEINIDNEGIWKDKIKLKKETTYIVKFEYFNADNNFIAKSIRYRVKIDTKDPDFDSMPLILNKRVGDRIWWNATDDYKIAYYKYYFNGQKIKTKDGYFEVANGTPRGAHTLLIRAYDKSGNKTDKIVLVRVK